MTTSSKDPRPKAKRKGIVLLTAMFFVTLLSLLAFAYITLVPTELLSALQDTNRTQAFYLANWRDSGPCRVAAQPARSRLRADV